MNLLKCINCFIYPFLYFFVLNFVDIKFQILTISGLNLRYLILNTFCDAKLIISYWNQVFQCFWNSQVRLFSISVKIWKWNHEVIVFKTWITIIWLLCFSVLFRGLMDPASKGYKSRNELGAKQYDIKGYKLFKILPIVTALKVIYIAPIVHVQNGKRHWMGIYIIAQFVVSFIFIFIKYVLYDAAVMEVLVEH